MSVIFVDDGPGDPKEEKKVGMKECHGGIKRSSRRLDGKWGTSEGK